MAKSNQIKKLVNGEIANADDINDIVESAGAEGGSMPYDPTTDQLDTIGGQSLGATAYPWGSIYLNQNSILGEVDPATNTLAASVTISDLRKFLNLKDVNESTFSGKGGQFVKVKTTEDFLEFSNTTLEGIVLAEVHYETPLTGTQASLTTIYNLSKFKKVSSIDTLTVYFRGRKQTASNEYVVQVVIGSASSAQQTYTNSTLAWQTAFTIDVSGLVDGTVYDIDVQMRWGSASDTYEFSDMIIFAN